MKAVILDFRANVVKVVTMKSVDPIDVEDELLKKGHLNSDCQWMVVKKLKIIKEKG